MRIKLSDHFTYRKLLRFTFSSIMMMIFMSIYGVVDGFFVTNFVGKTSFAAINLTYPVIDFLAVFGFMIGMGGSALIAKTLGEQKHKKANRLFSLFVYLSVALGVVMAVMGIVFLPAISSMLGARGAMLNDSVTYGRILLLALPALILQFEFQIFFVTAEKPKLGLVVTVLAGVTNMVLDALFIAVFRWGISGAAAATALSQFVGGILPLFYFSRENTSLLRLTKTSFDGKAVLRACTNGSSEFMSTISRSLVSMLFNVQLLRYAGENGVAAYGVLMYVNMVFSGVFWGYSSGSAPIIGYHYGAKNHSELKSLLKKSLIIVGTASVGMLIFSEVLAYPFSMIFVGYDRQLLAMTVHAFRIFSLSYLFASVAVFGSSFFTALNNGLVSAIIAFLRTLVFQLGAILILPKIWGIDGIWFSVVFGELMAAVVAVVFLVAKRSSYHY